MKFDYISSGVSRKKLVEKLRLNKVPYLIEGYVNIHQLPIFQKKIAYGKKSFPWVYNKSKYSYKKGICPIAEELHNKSFFALEICLFKLDKKNITFIINQFKKTWKELFFKNV